MARSSSPTPTDPAQIIRQMSQELGFALRGVAPAEPSQRGEYVRKWLHDGKHGEMAYLARHLDERLDPRKLLPGAKSVICVADRYPPEVPNVSTDTHRPPTATGQFARYARGEDYHRVIKKRLHKLADALRDRWPEHEYRSAVDTAPILEREHAVRAGLGWIGKNTLLLHPKLGSWLLLGEIVTTLPIDWPVQTITDHCGSCTRCIDACPTQCLTPYRMDPRRCISYLTIEHRTAIDQALHQPMGHWLGGCDICQEVCPYNRLESSPTSLSLIEALTMDDQSRKGHFRKSALNRIKPDMLRRNAVIAAGNHLAHHEDVALRKRIEQIAADPDVPAMVRETAGQVIRRVSANRGDRPKMGRL